MRTFKRICIEDYTVRAENDDTLTLRRGEEYVTSPERDGVVTVFSAFWVNVPVSLFSGEREFTPSDPAGAGVPPDHRIIQIVPWCDALMALTSRGEIYRLMEPLDTMPTNKCFNNPLTVVRFCSKRCRLARHRHERIRG